MRTRTGRFIPGTVAVLMLLPATLWGMDSRFELDMKALSNQPAAPKNGVASAPAKEARPAERTVKAVKKTVRRSPGNRSRSAAIRKEGRQKAAAAEPRYGLKLTRSPSPASDNTLVFLDRMWNELVPQKGLDRHTLDLDTGEFNLSLDPQKFPMIDAADGGRILIDRDRMLPPLVKSLLTHNQPDIRIVSENPANRGTFVKALLDAANFYSVQDGFDVEFGEDPKLIVHADFKIEQNAESLLKHDMILLNVGENERPMPPSLVEFLKKEGFRVVESASPELNRYGPRERQIYQITAHEPAQIADSVMSALSLRFDRDRSLELPGFSEQGIRLRIRADRYFEDRGERFVVSFFNGDPVRYTLVRLMETGGYRVIFLDPKDDVSSVAEKFRMGLGLSGSYGMHRLCGGRGLPYTVEMTGMMIRKPGSETPVLMTNRTLEPLGRELVEMNGYNVASF